MNDYDTSFGTLEILSETGDTELNARPVNNPQCAGDPVYLHSGQMYYQCNDLKIPGRKLDFDLTHTYFSGMSFNGQFGYGWMINYYMRLHKLTNGDVVIVSGDGQKTRYTYSNGTFTAPAGRFETLTENPDNSYTLTQAHGEEFDFDSTGKLTAVKDRNDNTITLTYDSVKHPVYGKSPFSQNPLNSIVITQDYRLIQASDTSGHTIVFNYNSNGLLSSVADGPRTLTFSYDPGTNDLLSVTKPVTAQFPDGVTKSFTYENHNVKKIQDPKGQYFVENFYDTNGRVIEQSLGGHSMYFNFTSPTQVTQIDRKGFYTTYDFNNTGNMTSRREFTAGLRAGEPASYLTTYTYNADSLQTSVTYPRGNGLEMTYDSDNPDARSRGDLLESRRKTSMASADDNANDIVTTFTYEPQFNQPKTITDPQGYVTIFRYDYELSAGDPKYNTKGDLIFLNQPMVTAGLPTTEFAYNAYGQVTQVKDPNGSITEYAYAPLTGYSQSVTLDPGGINAVTQFTYDVNGYPDTVTDANNHTTVYDYDALGWLNQVTNPLGYVTEYTYDANGNVAKIEKQASDPAGVWQTTLFTYDILNHLKTTTDPLNRVTTYSYDNNENLASLLDAENHTTTNVYDERNKLFTVTDANSPAGVTRYDYDANGNLAKITDANNNATNYAYDLFDRMDKTTYANGTFSQFSYDKNSNLTQHMTPSAKPINYVYDELNRLIAKNFPFHASLDTNYVYDLGTRLTDANNAAALIHHDYDALDRVESTEQTINAIPYTINYAYEDNGNLSQIVYPSTKTIDHTYDGNNRLDLVKADGTTLVDYDYDPLDRRDTKTFTALSPQQQTNYTFDAANQLATLTNTVLPSTNISTHTYPLYDGVGNRKQYDRTFQANPLETINYGYNDIYELTSVTGAQSHSYDYDLVGNREVADSVTYAANNSNQYNQVGATTYLYDGNGNLTFDGTNTYAYDEENRLTTYNLPFNAGGYAYDAFNRRVSKTVNGVTTTFIYDGDDVIADYNGAGTLTAEYIAGDSIDEMLSMERGGNSYYYHYDGLGSVTEMTDGSGALAENYTYDVYGQPSVVNSAIGNRYMFTGREYDEETGLYHYRARVYNSQIGKFMQRDPSGNIDSENLYQYTDSVGKPTATNPNNFTNAYHYTNNNPVNYTDPLGLFTIQIGIQNIGGAGKGASIEKGRAFGFSFKKGFSTSKYVTKGSGLYAGAGGSGALNFTFSKAESVCGLQGSAYSSGGSLDFGLSLGGDYNEAINSDNDSFSLNVGFGIGYPPGESHLFLTETYLAK